MSILLPGDRKTVFLNIIWHQHQPLYANPETDQLAGPWVRTHATKDYYDMAAMLEKYPDVHCTINLTSSLLHQLRDYYLDRLGPYIDVRKRTIDVAWFLETLERENRSLDRPGADARRIVHRQRQGLSSTETPGMPSASVR